MDEPQVVSYPLPLILDRLQNSVDKLGTDMAGRLERIEGQLAQKADLAAVAAVDGRVKVLETDKATRDAENRTGRRSLESKRGSWALAISGLAAIAAVGGAVVEAIHH